MIKKAVLLTLSAPFLMVFSDYSFADSDSCGLWHLIGGGFAGNAASARYKISQANPDLAVRVRGARNLNGNVYRYWVSEFRNSHCTDTFIPTVEDDTLYFNVAYTDEMCQAAYGGSGTINNISLDSSGSAVSPDAACSISSAGVFVCLPSTSSYDSFCSGDFSSESTGNIVTFSEENGDTLGTSSFTTLQPLEDAPLVTSDYLEALPGSCSDNSNCLTIGDTSYLVDWDTAPDYFQYVGSDGNTYSNPNAGGGSDGGDTGGGDPTYPTNPTDPTDPTDPGGNNGGDSGGSDGGNGSGDGSDDGSGGSSGGGSSGGGSTVPEFEFDESGIIEAIGSAGQSNRNAINALSNDVTGSINNQTNELNNATSAQTDALSGALSTQTDTLTNSLNSQTDNVTSALDDQTGTLTGALDALGTSIVDAINSLGSSSDEGEGEGEGGLWDGLIDSLAGLFGSGTSEAADGFASGLEETTSNEAFGEFDQQGYAEELFDTYESEQIGLLEERVEALLDMVDSGLSPYRNLISRLIPAVPSSSCTPIVFGSGHMSFTIDCEGFNLLKAMLAWVLYVFTAYTIVSTIFSYRSGAQQGA